MIKHEGSTSIFKLFHGILGNIHFIKHFKLSNNLINEFYNIIKNNFITRHNFNFASDKLYSINFTSVYDDGGQQHEFRLIYDKI